MIAPDPRLHDGLRCVLHFVYPDDAQPAVLAEAAAAPALRALSAGRRYRVRGVLIEGLPGCDPVVLVTVADEQAARPTAEALQERFGLTRQEARVALLLAERRTNAEIAYALCISPHTAKHHTEHVLQKLGVATRKAVGPFLDRGAAC